jgi:hypothetical protein
VTFLPAPEAPDVLLVAVVAPQLKDVQGWRPLTNFYLFISISYHYYDIIDVSLMIGGRFYANNQTRF